MIHRKSPEVSREERRLKWKEFWTKMLMASVLFICVPWSVCVYQRSTGLTSSTRISPGRPSTSADLSWTFDRAFAMTIAALPVLVLSALAPAASLLRKFQPCHSCV